MVTQMKAQKKMQSTEQNNAQIELNFSAGSSARRKMLKRGLSDAGQISNADMINFGKAERVCWNILRDGQEHTREEFVEATEQVEAIRRVRAVRRILEYQSLGTVVCERKGPARAFTYRYVERK